MPKLTRRQFIKYVGGTAAVLGLTELQLFELTKALANPAAPAVLWLQGGACTGCTTSFANVVTPVSVPWIFNYNPGLDPLPLPNPPYDGDVLDDNKTTVEDAVLNVVNLQYQQVIQAQSGDLAVATLKSWIGSGTNFVLAVEGVLPNDVYCTIGKDKALGYADLGIRATVQALAASPGCKALIAIGTCPSFGGWPGARSDDRYPKTNCVALSTLTPKTTINVPGCPVQPEVLLLTIAGAIVYLGYGSGAWSGGGLNPLLSGFDDQGRPLPYFADVLHRGPTGGATGDPLALYSRNGCPHYQQYSDGVFATKPGDDGCLMTIGCKGLSTKTPCNIYQWNAHQSYCVKANHPCYGCMEKGAPDKFEPFVKI